MTEPLTYRPGTPNDSYTVFRIFEETLADLMRRSGSTVPASWSDPEALARMWEERRGLYEHLARTSDRFWLAERGGEAIGFARSIRRGGVRQLTEFFVRPGLQSGGVGRELLARAFPANGAERRSIIASGDVRALALYLRSGVYPRFQACYFGRRPEAVAVEGELDIVPASASPETLAAIGDVDGAVLGYRHDADHDWLLRDRQGYLYHRAGAPVGYGYTGPRAGPFALLDPGDFPAVLAHAEAQAANQGQEHFGVEVPLANRIAVDHLLARGYRMDAFVATLMTDEPFGRFEQYVLPSPPFFL